MNQFRYKIFTLLPPRAAVDSMNDWQGEDFPLFQTTDNIEECLAQPYRVAAVPAMFNQPGSYSYNQTLCSIDWSKFDLVILSDIEYIEHDTILTQCINPCNIKNYVLAVGGVKDRLIDLNVVYRPWWIFQHMRLNSFKPYTSESRPFLFEALLGARRVHRSYVMARFCSNPDLLTKSIVTYRQEFGFDGNDPSMLLNAEAVDVIKNNLIWPYVSPNLNSNWEVSDNIRRDISEITPWEIYNKTYYSICCETLFQHFDPTKSHDPGPFFITEKIAKVLLGQRLFVLFGPMHTLKFLQELGFKTFDNVIDESYDNCGDSSLRFKLAFDQVEALSKLDPEWVLKETEHIRIHNYNHLYQYRKDIRNQLHQMILDKIPEQHKFA
jgi:hypothetical protein